ncbi:hypothetical protein BDZ89DRAFT_271866 [Hymenopellis radicata]|nr:hypothetical protein BDZ89DRAFT_271866 [Hymenopellis radicata]
MVTATPISLDFVGPGAKPCLLFLHGYPSSSYTTIPTDTWCPEQWPQFFAFHTPWNMEMTDWWRLGSHYFYAVACAVVVLARSYVVLRR